MPILFLALAVGLVADAAEQAKPKAHPPARATRVPVPAVEGKPLLSNPQLSLDGKTVYVARLGLPSAPPSEGLDVTAIALPPAGKPKTISFPVRVNGNRVKLMASADGKYLAVLSDGELWIKTIADPAEPRRLYPPAEGEAQLGPSLTQASFAADSTWLLIQSPSGWAWPRASSRAYRSRRSTFRREPWP